MRIRNFRKDDRLSSQWYIEDNFLNEKKFKKIVSDPNFEKTRITYTKETSKC